MTDETKIIVNPDTRIVATSGISLNYIVNVGGEGEVYKGIVANIAELRTMKAGANMSITQEGNNLVFDVVSGGTGSTNPIVDLSPYLKITDFNVYVETTGIRLQGIENNVSDNTDQIAINTAAISNSVDLSLYLKIADFDSYTGTTNTRLQGIEGDVSDNAGQIAINIVAINGKTDLTLFNAHKNDASIHYEQSAIAISENQVTNLTTDLNNKLAQSDFDIYSGTTQNTLIGLRTDVDTISGDTEINATNIQTNIDRFANYVPASGGTFTGNLQATNLQLSGDLTVNGSMNIVHAQDVYTENDFIFMRSGATSGLGTGEVSGIAALNVDGLSTTAVMGVTNDGIIRVGWSGDTLVAVAGREDAPIDGGYAYWDNVTHIFKTYDLNSDVTGNTALINAHADNTDIHYAQSAITISENQVIDLVTDLTGKTNVDLFNSHTGNTDIHFTMGDITGFTSTDDFNAYTGDTDTRLDTIESNVSGNTSVIETKANKLVTIDSIAASTYIIVSSDNNKILEVSTGCTITMPTGLTNGFQLTIVNTGSGTITFSAGSGAALLSKDSKVSLADQYGAVASYFKNNNWTLIGDLS